MAIAIILIYGESRHLVAKPADYATLIAVARAKFRELEGVTDDTIAFHFTPEWFQAEVQIDDGAFSEVHDRAILRITTTGSAPAQNPGPDAEAQDAEISAQCRSNFSIKQESDSSVPPHKHMIPIVVSLYDYGEYRYEVGNYDTLGGLMDDAAERLLVPLDVLVFSFEGQEFDEHDTPRDLGLKPEDTVEVDCYGSI